MLVSDIRPLGITVHYITDYSKKLEKIPRESLAELTGLFIETPCHPEKIPSL